VRIIRVAARRKEAREGRKGEEAGEGREGEDKAGGGEEPPSNKDKPPLVKL
jgi:hypothetical protein